MSDILKLSAYEMQRQMEQGQLGALEATEAYLAEIEKREAEVGAYLLIEAERAKKQAQEMDARRAKGERLGALAGIPMALKDNLCTKGIRTTCASRMLEHFVPPYDAFVAEKLRDSVLLGKLNMDEFAMGSSTENSYFHPTRNPVNLEHVPGGSSGGSAAAVAAGEAVFSLGSDTGGSIRQPAAFCGVVGMKPTYGAVSRYGLIAFASSLDQIGPLTRDVRDSALVLSAIAGHDKRDATSVSREYGDYGEKLGQSIRGMKIALPEEFFGEGLQSEIRQSILDAAKTMEQQGAEIVQVSMPALKNALPAYYVISSAEASSNLARFDGIKYGFRSENFDGIEQLYERSRSEGFGAEVKRRIMLGSFVLSAGYYDAYYKKALEVRTLIGQEFERVLKTCDMILSPVAPTTAYRLGEKTGDPLQMYLGDIYTVPVNIAGLPALSLPCGKDAAGLPIGMQLIGRAFGEVELYQVAYAFEQEKGAAR
ncbi:MAG: Asp-tRNA(Asn)/Glu-tRNA(Gln) amidotransferase subunit GatA [Clostridiales bacterium]|nr:Asp-tRNA(Asn)/Glu-tRNA(Gln) amidotransferase subunit GatA [Clostridiales bacterium]